MMIVEWSGMCVYKAKKTWISISMGDFAADCPQSDATCLVSNMDKRVTLAEMRLELETQPSSIATTSHHHHQPPPRHVSPTQQHIRHHQAHCVQHGQASPKLHARGSCARMRACRQMVDAGRRQTVAGGAGLLGEGVGGRTGTWHVHRALRAY